MGVLFDKQEWRVRPFSRSTLTLLHLGADGVVMGTRVCVFPSSSIEAYEYVVRLHNGMPGSHIYKTDYDRHYWRCAFHHQVRLLVLCFQPFLFYVQFFYILMPVPICHKISFTLVKFLYISSSAPLVSEVDLSFYFCLYRLTKLPHTRSSIIWLPFDRSTLHDTVQSYNFWPPIYDARAIIGPAYQDHLTGIPNEENIAKYQKAMAEGDPEGRRIVYAWVFSFLRFLCLDLHRQLG